MKKLLLITSLIALFISAFGQQTPLPSYFVIADNFKDLGTWKVQSSGIMGLVLQGTANRKPEETKPAIADIKVAKAGKYKIWVHARDFIVQQGSRHFQLKMNGVKLPVIFGQHGENSFKWTDGGVVSLTAGLNELQLLDNHAFYARCDAIFITADLQATPSEDYTKLINETKPLNMASSREAPIFPKWANNSGAVIKQTAIENDAVKITFFQLKDKDNGLFVQNEIAVKSDKGWVKVKDRTDDHAYLMLKAENNVKGNWIDGFILKNAYQQGVPFWLIPSDFQLLPNNEIKLTFNTIKEVETSVIWSLVPNDKEPKVTINAKFKENGNFSFALFSGKEYKDEEYENALAPFRVMEKRVPKEPLVFLEHYLFTPMGSVSLPETNTTAPGYKLTTAIVVDPTSIARRFAYRENASFGISLRGPNGGLRGTLFAPVFGSEGSVFKAGDKYTISYKVVNALQPWFATYKHIAQDIFKVIDYRNNYYTSLNDAIFNTTDLMLDDKVGGWDSVNKAHYNMEERDLTSVANPMAAIQRYLLTEDENILSKRAIPTLASLFTRERLHFKRFDTQGGANYLAGVAKPTAIGKPIGGYNLNVFGGLYEMTRGMTPQLLTTGLKNSKTVTNSYGNIPPFSNDLALYRYTKNLDYLKVAKEKADKYLLDVVYNDKYNSEMPPMSKFINIAYFPNLASLIDIYEITKEKRYLDAAIKTGQMLVTSLWVPGVDGDKATAPLKIVPNEVIKRPFIELHDFWWYGSERWRAGSKKGEAKTAKNSDTKLQEETVPGWVPARVGLGLEQATTFGEALNIYMSSWAGDLMKLSELSGEEYFSVAAKNAIIGRFSTYPGYYQDRFMTHQMKADYPYKGPDITGLYWHHIPPFLSMLEDFLINEVWAKSKQKIEFPSVRQQGYAYFNSNQYGFAPGKFYDLENMWLWNDRGIVKPSSININYLPVKKDGVFAVALMNEAATITKTTITLGEKVIGGTQYSGKAKMYTENGDQQTIEIKNGKFDIEIPAKGMRSVSINLPGVKAPKFASVMYDVKGIGNQNTIAEHARGKAYVFQLSPEKYFAYLYVSDQQKETKQLTINYKIGSKAAAVTVKNYPFEAIIQVNEVAEDFLYDLEVTHVDGTVEKIKGGKISPVRK